MVKMVKIVAGSWFDMFENFGLIALCEDGRHRTCTPAVDVDDRYSLSSFGDDNSMLIDRKTKAEMERMLETLPSVAEWDGRMENQRW